MLLVWRVFYECFADIFPTRADIPAPIADIYFPPRADKMLTQKIKKSASFL